MPGLTDPVRDLGILVEADELDGVVELDARVLARARGHDAALVHGPLRGVARHGDRAVREQVGLGRKELGSWVWQGFGKWWVSERGRLERGGARYDLRGGVEWEAWEEDRAEV